MISISRLVVGIFLMVGGAALSVLSFFSSFIFLIYSLPMVAIGIWILANNSEDKIEERKDIKAKESKR